jgi:hypothetical protein
MITLTRYLALKFNHHSQPHSQPAETGDSGIKIGDTAGLAGLFLAGGGIGSDVAVLFGL